MKILSVTEASTLLRTASLDAFITSISKRLRLDTGPYAIPPDSGAKTSLARHFADLLQQNLQLFVYFRNWNIWPSSENFDLFDGYRRSMGERRPLSESQVHLFSPGDQATFTSILSMGLYFVWDVDVFDTNGKILLTFSHDEWMEFRADEAATTKQIEQGLAGFELKQLTR